MGSPSGMFIAPDDSLYFVDYNDRKGIFIASAETGIVRQKQRGNIIRKFKRER